MCLRNIVTLPWILVYERWLSIKCSGNVENCCFCVFAALYTFFKSSFECSARLSNIFFIALHFILCMPQLDYMSLLFFKSFKYYDKLFLILCEILYSCFWKEFGFVYQMSMCIALVCIFFFFSFLCYLTLDFEFFNFFLILYSCVRWIIIITLCYMFDYWDLIGGRFTMLLSCVNLSA